jgi:hypothetical protein
MASNPTEQTFRSTTWRSEMRRVARRPEGPSSASTEGRPSPLSARDLREPLTMTVRYRGGPEAWFEVKARGRSWRFPGCTALYDALVTVYEGQARRGEPNASPPHHR